MHVTAISHFAPPYSVAGSERLLHQLLRSSAQRGHEVKLIHTDQSAPEEYEHEGVIVQYRPMDQLDAAVFWNESNVIIAQHHLSRIAFPAARRAGKKTIFMAHMENEVSDDMFEDDELNPNIVIVNSKRYLPEKVEHLERTIALRPVLYPEDHKATRGSCITMVNPHSSKGSDIFYALAKEFPGEEFLACRAVHAMKGDDLRFQGNVTIMDPTRDMRNDVYGKTKILLYPSRHETWGLAAVEACASGIPVIASDIPALRESLGDAGTFCPVDDLKAWKDALKALLADEGKYIEASAESLERATQLADRAPEEEWDAILCKLNDDWIVSRLSSTSSQGV